MTTTDRCGCGGAADTRITYASGRTWVECADCAPITAQARAESIRHGLTDDAAVSIEALAGP